MSSKTKIFAAFTGDEILKESGRLPFALLNPFVRAGYEVLVCDNLRARLAASYQRDEVELPETARLTLSMPGVVFTSRIPDDPGDTLYVFDRPLDAAHGRAWKRRLQVRFDLFAPYWLRAPVIAPYAMHPAQATQRRHGVADRHGTGGDFRQKWLEDEVVDRIDQFDFGQIADAPLQFLCGEHAGKAAAQHENPRFPPSHALAPPVPVASREWSSAGA